VLGLEDLLADSSLLGRLLFIAYPQVSKPDGGEAIGGVDGDVETALVAALALLTDWIRSTAGVC